MKFQKILVHTPVVQTLDRAIHWEKSFQWQPSKLKLLLSCHLATKSFGLRRLFYKSSHQLQNFRRHDNLNSRNLEGWVDNTILVFLILIDWIVSFRWIVLSNIWTTGARSIVRHWNCFLLSVAMDGKNRHRLKFEKNHRKKLIFWLVLPEDICLISSP